MLGIIGLKENPIENFMEKIDSSRTGPLYSKSFNLENSYIQGWCDVENLGH